MATHHLKKPLRFAGSDYDPKRDNARLSNQLHRIKGLMADGVFRTLSEISQATGEPEASISAQLRHLRKERFGSNAVNKRHLGGGLYSYQLVLNRNPSTHCAV